MNGTFQTNKKYNNPKIIKSTKTSNSGAINNMLALKVYDKPKSKTYYMDEDENIYIIPYTRIVIKRIKTVTNLNQQL